MYFFFGGGAQLGSSNYGTVFNELISGEWSRRHSYFLINFWSHFCNIFWVTALVNMFCLSQRAVFNWRAFLLLSDSSVFVRWFYLVHKRLRNVYPFGTGIQSWHSSRENFLLIFAYKKEYISDSCIIKQGGFILNSALFNSSWGQK